MVPGGEALGKLQGVADSGVLDGQIAVKTCLLPGFSHDPHLDRDTHNELALAIGRPTATLVGQAPASRVVVPDPHRYVFPVDPNIVPVALPLKNRFVPRDWHFWGAGKFPQNSGGVCSSAEPKGHERSA